jgi:hypothetical protein
MGEDERIRRAQVDGQVTGKEAEKGPHIVNAGITHLKAVRRHRYLLSFPEQSFTERDSH